MHGLMRALLANAVTGRGRGLQQASSRSSASATRPSSRAARCTSRSATRTRWSSRSRRASRSRSSKANRITVTGADRQQVGQVAAEIRACAARPLQGQGHQVRGRECFAARSARPAPSKARARQEGEHDDGSGTQEGHEEAARESAPTSGSGSGSRAPRSVRAWRSSRARSYIYAQVIDDDDGHDAGRRPARSSRTLKRRSIEGGAATMAAAKAVGEAIAERALDEGHRAGGVRPRRLPLPRQGQGAGRRGARQGPGVLEPPQRRRRDEETSFGQGFRARRANSSSRSSTSTA